VSAVHMDSANIGKVLTSFRRMSTLSSLLRKASTRSISPRVADERSQWVFSRVATAKPNWSNLALFASMQIHEICWNISKMWVSGKQNLAVCFRQILKNMATEKAAQTCVAGSEWLRRRSERRSMVASSFKSLDAVVRQCCTDAVDQMRCEFCDLVSNGFLERIRR
jgi:hypothetical protein